MKRAILTILSLMLLLPLATGQKTESYYKVRRARFSTSRDEVAAVPYVMDGDTFLVYAAQRRNEGFKKVETPDGKGLFDIYYRPLSKKKEGIRGGKSRSGKGREMDFIPKLNTKRHEGPVSFTADFKTMVVSLQRPSSSSKVDPMGLYFIENADGEWDLNNMRAFEHNVDSVWFFSPAFSSNGDTLIFAANFRCGEGGYDLYYSCQKGDSWSKPESLGPEVNSAGNEFYPFYHPSGTLYFSSDGHDNGEGRYDLFETRVRDGEWTEVSKLPEPFNDALNDYHIWLYKDRKDGGLTRGLGSKNTPFVRLEQDFEPPAPKPYKKTYYTKRLYDRKLDTVDTNLFRYSWVINDTLELPGHEVIYRFPEPGVYKCRMNVFDIQLDSLIEGEKILTVRIRLPEQAVFDSDKDTVHIGETVTFDASRTWAYLPYDVDEYIWNFESLNVVGGPGRNNKVVTHTFSSTGTKPVILSVNEKIDKRARQSGREVEPRKYSIVRYITVIQ